MAIDQADEQPMTIQGKGAHQTFSAAWFGGQRLSTGSLPTDRLFTGQIRNLDDDRIYFFKVRYYDARIGKFHTPDTIVPKADNPQALNRYAYALNNPPTLVDPCGHGTTDPNRVKQFEAAPGRHAPPQRDWQDYQFSLANPGSRPNGTSTNADWQ